MMQRAMLQDLSAVQKWVQSFVKNLGAGDIVLLKGDVGAGKTTLCREIIKYFCGSAVTVISPTFHLLQTYYTPEFIIYHFDLHRLNSIVELDEIGIEDALQHNLCLIEWPELIEHILPRPLFAIDIQIIDSAQRLLLLNTLC